MAQLKSVVRGVGTVRDIGVGVSAVGLVGVGDVDAGGVCGVGVGGVSQLS